MQKIRVQTKEKTYEGMLMPDSTKEKIFLKLDNGYNVGIEARHITKQDVIGEIKQKRTEKKKASPKKGLKKIIILHTGGTIASKVDYESGGVSAKFTAEDMLDMVPELSSIANIETELVSNMMSEDMNFSDHAKIINSVKKHIGTCDGIIIGHGTDTMTYTSAALAFAFEGLPLPVLLVGSQRSFDRGSADAAMNLICAAHFIVKSGFSGVGICMHDRSHDDKCAILPATKSRKMHTTRRDAFKAINTDPIALIDIDGKISNYTKQAQKASYSLKEKFSDKVCILKMHPNFSKGLLEYATKNFDALVIEGTGLGHMPTNTPDNLHNYEILGKFIKNGGIVAMASQCVFGRVQAHVYSNLRRLHAIGVIFCEDMLSETAFVKLSWLLGNFSKEEAKKMLPQNLRGEISDRTLYKEDFLE